MENFYIRDLGLNELCHYNCGMDWLKRLPGRYPFIPLSKVLEECQFFFPFASEGVQGMSPQNTQIWHVAYFALKAREKQQRQDGHSDPPFYSWKQDIKLPWERCDLCARKEEDVLITRDTELRQKELCTNRPCSNNSYLPLASLQCLVTFPQLLLFFNLI